MCNFKRIILYLVIMPFKVTPVPIPNTMVKLLGADGTACASVWESRLLPDFFYFDSLAQSVEHVTFNHGVQGSIPWRVTKALVYTSAFFTSKINLIDMKLEEEKFRIVLSKK